MAHYPGITKSRERINNVECTTIKFASFAVADLPSASGWANTVVFVTDGAAGAPVLAFSDGTNWLRCDTRAAVSAGGEGAG